jgi:hypothetical protein
MYNKEIDGKGMGLALASDTPGSLALRELDLSDSKSESAALNRATHGSYIGICPPKKGIWRERH